MTETAPPLRTPLVEVTRGPHGEEMHKISWPWLKFFSALKTGLNVTSYVAAADVIHFPNSINVAVLNRSGAVNAATLATPTAADTGKLLTIINGQPQANTVTTATGKIVNGSGTAYQVLTAAANEGAIATLIANNLLWYVIALSNFTLS
jgi:hypothetical protein